MVVEAGFNVHQLVESVLIRDKILPTLGPGLALFPHPDSVVVRTPETSGQWAGVVGLARVLQSPLDVEDGSEELLSADTSSLMP